MRRPLLRVGSAFPDPPFDVSRRPPGGLDVDLMRAVAARLGREYELHRYAGADFEGIYDALVAGDFDVVTSGATSLRVVQTGITDERIASAVRLDDTALSDAIDAAQRALAADGTLAELGRRWLRDRNPRATSMIT